MKNPVDGFSAGLTDENNIYEWSVTVIGPPETLYEGGFFTAILSFPRDYPQSPPICKFKSEMWHPNGKSRIGRLGKTDWSWWCSWSWKVIDCYLLFCFAKLLSALLSPLLSSPLFFFGENVLLSSFIVYPDGKVCISILHSPGDDPSGYELASERWSPIHTVETIMLSIISMLSSPNDESPANIDAAKVSCCSTAAAHPQAKHTFFPNCFFPRTFGTMIADRPVLRLLFCFVFCFCFFSFTFTGVEGR